MLWFNGHEVGQNVDRDTLFPGAVFADLDGLDVLQGDLHPGNEFDAESLAGGRHAGVALGGVVVGQGKRGDSDPVGVFGQNFGVVRTVGEVGVHMEINHALERTHWW